MLRLPAEFTTLAVALSLWQARVESEPISLNQPGAGIGAVLTRVAPTAARERR